MRPTIRTSRTVMGASLLGLALVLLLATMSASFNTEPAAASTPTRPDESAAEEGGIVLASSLNVRVLDQTVARDVDIDPPATRGTDLPGFTVDRHEKTALPAEVPLAADLNVHLALGSHIDRAPPAADEATLASAEATAINAPAPLVMAAALLAGAGLLTLAWGHVKTGVARFVVLPVIALYAKVSRAEVFDNQIREKIFETIRDHPGTAATDLGKTASVAWGTTMYHLDVLEQTGMVVSIREGRHRRYFANGAQLGGTKESIAILQNATTATVIDRIRGMPGASGKDLATSLAMSPQALHWHLVRLVGAGLVRKERDGRIVKHFAQ